MKRKSPGFPPANALPEGTALRPEPQAQLEAARARALADYGILDTPTEPVFDDIVRLAADICEAPIALVSFITPERQWFKAETGIGIREMPLGVSICRFALLQPGLFVVADLQEDPRFAQNPLVEVAGGLRFYAGALIETSDGLPLGTVCVLDTVPRPEGLAARQGQVLQALARQVMSELELRRAVTERDLQIARARETQDDLERTQLALTTLNRDLATEVTVRTAERERLWRLSTDIMLVARADGSITAVNPAWTVLLGWGEDELLGRSFLDFVHPEDLGATTAEAARLNEGRRTAHFENRYRHKDGSYRWLSWTAVPEEGYVHGVARDVTAEKLRAADLEAAREQLRQSQKLEAVGQLTGGVAHDFNNLLTVIRGSVELLMRPNVTEERRSRYIQAIADTATRATKLTSQLLAFARRQALRPEVFDAGQSVAAISDMVGTLTGSRVRIVTDIPDMPVFINADPSQFDTALVNLAVNARDAMGGEGELKVTVQAVSGVPRIRANPPVAGDFVQVSMADTGSGIPPDKIGQIFEPFFTTKGVGQGTGLGLSQVFGFVKQSGGEVAVESQPDQGATFTLYLPRVAAPAHPSPETVTAEPLIEGQGSCILVVEDNPQVGQFATQTLAELGFATVLAPDAATALLELEKDAARFDVVFSDVVMPGMNGVELGHEIRRRHAELPVVLASGYSHVLAENGAHGFELLHKPYSIEALSRVLRKAAGWRLRARGS